MVRLTRVPDAFASESLIFRVKANFSPPSKSHSALTIFPQSASGARVRAAEGTGYCEFLHPNVPHCAIIRPLTDRFGGPGRSDIPDEYEPVLRPAEGVLRHPGGDGR